MRRPLLGAHVSSAGGVDRAIERAAELRVGACQIFVKSPSQWRGRRLTHEEIERFRVGRTRAGLSRVVAHGTYLVNLAATDPANRERSVATLSEELRRASVLGLDGLVVHPGAHLGAGEEQGLRRIARSIDRVLSAREDTGAPLLLENTAGQGTVLGHRFEQLARILEMSRHGDALGLCLDTCHAFAAGYPIHRKEGVERLLDEIEQVLGLERLVAIHLNDSRYALASRRDRHANLGKGEIGLAAFRALLHEPRLEGIPMILETPRGDDGEGHRRDLETLRSEFQRSTAREASG